MKKRRALLFLSLSLIFSFGLFCQEAVAPESQTSAAEQNGAAAQDFSALKIIQFNIDGLKRTKRSYMDGLLADFLQKPASAQTLKGVETLLQAQNLFDQIKVAARPLDDTSAVVEISFKEKWSVLPLPFGYYSDGSYSIGGFLMDMNAFGRGCNAAVGGLYSPTGVMGAAMFRKPPTQKGSLGFFVAGSVSKSEHAFANSKNRGVFGYENFYAGGRGGLMFKPASFMTASVGAGYSFFNPINSSNVNKANQWSVDASIGFSTSDWNGTFLCSNSLNVGAELLFSDNPDQRFAQTVNFSAQVQRAVASRLRLVSAARGFFSNDLYVTNFVGRGSSGLTLLPKNFASSQMFGFFTGFEAAVIKIKFGMMSVYALYGVAAARDWDKTLYVCHGPEAGVRFYLSKVAFPAFAMGGSYNIEEDRFQFSISGGVSF